MFNFVTQQRQHRPNWIKQMFHTHQTKRPVKQNKGNSRCYKMCWSVCCLKQQMVKNCKYQTHNSATFEIKCQKHFLESCWHKNVTPNATNTSIYLNVKIWIINESYMTSDQFQCITCLSWEKQRRGKIDCGPITSAKNSVVSCVPNTSITCK